MGFLKKHYEKVLLGVVLLGLAVAVAFLPWKIASEKQDEEAQSQQALPARVERLKDLNLSDAENALKRVASPVVVDFSAPNRLFNPMAWQKAPQGGRLSRVDSSRTGPNALTVLKLTPLYLKLMLEKVNIYASIAETNYSISVEKEAALYYNERRKMTKSYALGAKSDVFTVREVKAPADNPTNATVTVELNDTQQRVPLKVGQLFRRIDGYKADLKYADTLGETHTWTDQRVGSALSFGGEAYNIVAITENEVVLSARSNQKKWTIRFSGGAAP